MSKLVGIRSGKGKKFKTPAVPVPQVGDAGLQKVIEKCLKQRQEGYLPYKIMSPREIKERAEVLADPRQIYEHFWKPLCDADAMSVEWMEKVLNYNPKQRRNRRNEKKKESYDWISVCHDYKMHLANGGMLPMKLVFASIGGGNALTQYIAKSVSLYGVVHVLLQVGPLTIGWDHGCVILPTPSHDDWFCERAFAVLPITYTLPATEETFMTISEVMADYNRTKAYGVFNSTDSAKAKVNCHCFVNTIMLALNRPPPWRKTGLVATYLENVRLDARKYGKAMIPGSDLVFETHAALDKYVIKKQQQRKLRPNQALDSEVFFLLKAFDRAFWLREGIWQKSNSNCPFMVPDPLRATVTVRRAAVGGRSAGAQAAAVAAAEEEKKKAAEMEAAAAAAAARDAAKRKAEAAAVEVAKPSAFAGASVSVAAGDAEAKAKFAERYKRMEKKYKTLRVTEFEDWPPPEHLSVGGRAAGTRGRSLAVDDTPAMVAS